jgi:acetylcholinesterase
MGYFEHAWPEDLVVSGLIVGSGTALLHDSDDGFLDPTHSSFTFVAEKLGCCNLLPREELECMRGISGGGHHE